VITWPVGAITKQAVKKYNDQQFGGAVNLPVNYFIGYPIHDHSANLSSTQTDEKVSIFMEYASHDNATCISQNRCRSDQAYGAYLMRNYTNKY
jgi:hypothetical protein